MHEEKRAEKKSQRKTFQNQFFKCLSMRNTKGDGKLFLRIGKKYTRNAVMRNKVKRWIREIYRKSGIKGKFDIVINLKKEPEYDFRFFEKNLMNLFSRIK